VGIGGLAAYRRKGGEKKEGWKEGKKQRKQKRGEEIVTGCSKDHFVLRSSRWMSGESLPKFGMFTIPG
jgi:hypothetical protein